MANFYETSRAHYQAIASSADSADSGATDDAKIASLRALVAQLDTVQQGLESAVTDLQNSGQTNNDLSRALLVATFNYTSTQQLLVLALDGREEIQAAADAMDKLTERLKGIATSTQGLIGTIGTVKTILDDVGKVTKLATT